MAKGIKNKKQHYVPQCYLRGFSNDGKGFFTFNKVLEKHFPIAIKDACQIDDFYKIHRKFVDENERAQFDENFYESIFFADQIEKEYSKLLTLVKDNLANWIATSHQRPAFDNTTRDLLSAYLGIQVLRLPQVRSDFYKAYRKAQEKRFEIIKGFVAGNDIDLQKFADTIILEQDDDYASVVHAEIYANDVLINGMQDRLRDKTWAFLVSNTNDLYSSDFPLVIIPHYPGQRPYYNGLGMRGAQIVVPITGKLAISMWDPDLFDHSKYQAEQFQTISDLDKRLFNLYQYANAETNIFCSTNKFDFIEKVKSDGLLSSVYVYKSRTEVY